MQNCLPCPFSLAELKLDLIKINVTIFKNWGRDGCQMVSIFTFYSDYPSLNPAESPVIIL